MSGDRTTVVDAAELAAEPVVGTVIEPGDEVGEFVFAAPDGQAVSTGEFVAYSQSTGGNSDEVVLARVSDREREAGLPASFMTDPDVDAGRVATALGAEADGGELYCITAEVIGYYDPGFESFRNPRKLPDTGTRLYRAPGEMLEVVIPNVTPPGFREEDDPDPGMAWMGRLLNRADEKVTVELPVNEVAATHLAILASTGSGKSYTASVLLEEMLKPATRASVLVFDPHGEYDSLDQMCDHPAFEGADGYRPSAEIRKPDQLSVKLADLTYADLRSILDPTERMSSVLSDAYDDLRSEDAFTVNDLEQACHRNHPDGEASGLKWRINRNLQQSDFFDAYDRLDLDALVNPGQVTVLRMDGLSRRDQQVMAAVLLRKLYEGREAVVVGDPDDVRTPIEHPVFTLFEEAHRFAPDGDSQALSIIRQVNSEGRKFGIGTGLITQRPSKLDQTVLSQCGTQITMQIKNPNDQQAIRDSVEGAGAAVLDELPGLTKGQAVISGDAVNTPVLTKIRERHTEHDAENLKADQLWREAYDDAQNAPSSSAPADIDDGSVFGSGEEL
ncbi:ATP-binding protein [Halobacteria archaeon AArc-dxtr1]|nr:ATP-binding protein [Halobacteria archaeon AArc-dxtr1]